MKTSLGIFFLLSQSSKAFQPRAFSRSIYVRDRGGFGSYQNAMKRDEKVIVQAVPESADDPEKRTFAVGALWLGLIVYASFLAPGRDAASQALDSELLSKLISDPFDPTVSPILVAVFNFLGLWPAVMASLLLPGSKDQNIPAAPFLLGSVAFGMFALSPYVALRKLRTENIKKPTGFSLDSWFESKINATLLLLGFSVLLSYSIRHISNDPLTAAADYYSLFSSQLFVHVSTLDFSALYLLSFGILDEDRRRRPHASPSLSLLAALPLAGPLIYLLIRPQLPSSDLHDPEQDKSSSPSSSSAADQKNKFPFFR